MPESQVKYWSVKEVAEYLGMKVQTIYNMVHNRNIPFHKIGLKSVRFKKEEIDAWIEANKRQSPKRYQYVMKDGYPRCKYVDINKEDLHGEFCTRKEIIDEALESYRFHSIKYSLSLGRNKPNIKKELDTLLKKGMVLPSMMLNNRFYFSHSESSRLFTLVLIAEIAAVEWSESVKFYETLLAAMRRNARNDFSFDPYSTLSEAERSYYTEDIVIWILEGLREAAILFITEGDGGFKREYIDFESFVQAYILGFLYFSYNDYIDGWSDREGGHLILKERGLEEMSPKYIETGLRTRFFLPEEILTSLEKHIHDIEEKAKALKRIVRGINKDLTNK